MKDPRIEKLASVLINYSTRLKRGDILLIEAIGTPTLPFVKELHRQALAKGAKYVEIWFTEPEIAKDLYDLAKPSQINYFPEHKLEFMKKVDAYIGVRAPENSMVFANTNQKNLIAHSKVMRPILDERVNNTRWVVTRWPCHGFAQEAKMSLEELEDFYFAACIQDWAAVKKRQAKLANLMKRTKEIRVRASDTDLVLRKDGLPAVNCHGDRNIPDGEVYTAPIRDRVNGYITFNCPTVYQGQEFDGIRLEFENGKVVKATCSVGDEKKLNAILDTDEGARYIGEFALGTNYSITVPMRNILFDEKIGGSIHMACGMAYEECDNGNKSAIHWDIIKILKGDGEIYFDGKLIQKDGYFVHPQLVDLNPPKKRGSKKKR